MAASASSSFVVSLPPADAAAFEAWCTAAGIWRRSVRHGAASSSSAGQGVFAVRDIAQGEEFVSVPVSACITERVAQKSEVGQVVAQENEERERKRAELLANGVAPAALPHRISPRTLLYLYLIYARHSRGSPFQPWLVHGVPREYDLPVMWSHDDPALR